MGLSPLITAGWKISSKILPLTATASPKWIFFSPNFCFFSLCYVNLGQGGIITESFCENKAFQPSSTFFPFKQSHISTQPERFKHGMEVKGKTSCFDFFCSALEGFFLGFSLIGMFCICWWLQTEHCSLSAIDLDLQAEQLCPQSRPTWDEDNSR